MQMKEIKKAQTQYDERHGGAYDRGSADYYYARGRHPHMFMGDTYNSAKVIECHMTESEILAYNAGYDDAASWGDRKDWR
jgi:hypothetical protein|tara:strand:- start:293 stop:532 length:240 start_codon:yes stop_codon:yes gene_type:complete